MNDLSRRDFARLAASAVAVGALPAINAAAAQQPARGAVPPAASAAVVPKPDFCRGVVYTPPAGQGERYWRVTPGFETASEKYVWLNRIAAVGVSYTVPQRVSYRIFQVL